MVVRLLVALASLAVAWLGFFFYRDNFSTHYGAKAVSATAFRSGEIPWWNFHAPGGQPLAGNSNLLTFYPDNVLYLFLPAHVAFNLHFLLHLIAGFYLMRALCRARGVSERAANFAATMYVLSGVVVSATAFYNLVTAVALLPLALLAIERKSWQLLGLAFGLMLLAAEPVTLIGAAILCAGRTLLSLRAIVAAALIAAPQLIAYSEIAAEVERAVGFSARTVLTTSLTPLRVAELFLWPFSGFLNDASAPRLFSTLFLGIIALPALFRRSRYAAAAVVLLLLAIGSYNPLVRVAVEQFASVRILRFPEKFALPLTAALVVLIALFFERTRYKRVWMAVTLVPLLWTTYRALPLDWFTPYDVPRVEAPGRMQLMTANMAGLPAREEYRRRAERYEPLFGAAAGVRYAIGRSSDNMHSLRSRIVAERFAAVPLDLKRRYVQVATSPPFLVPRTVAAQDMVPAFERSTEHVAPRAFTSAPGRVVAYREVGQTIEVDVEASGPVLLFVNQSYFKAWVARANAQELETLPVDIDRLGVVVPGTARVTLTFGRRRGLIVAAWVVSLLVMVALGVSGRTDRTNRTDGTDRTDGTPAEPFVL
ncbi:MAG TPA: hypothetical protein VF618_27410 [Thermoanaerobaculia bacterium]